MGVLFSRRDARIEELDSATNNAYRYPPKSGNYFASHFIMAGERFQTTQPEAYLFGENMDLNFLGGKPTPFPYPAPQPNEPTRTLKSLINIRKESLRFVRVSDQSEEDSTPSENSTFYNIEFFFDSDVRCAITIYYFCTEDITANGVIYTPQDPTMNSETYHYKKGASQQFCQVSHIFDPSKYSDVMLSYKFEDEVIPVLIQCVAEEGEEPRQSHMLFGAVEKNDGAYSLKPLKQKLFVDGLCYLLQEIYGIENKANAIQPKDVSDEDVEDSGSECVICMSERRDTLILPCRHLCLCNSCADSLRYQANNCPICRAPFRALLQIRAVRKSNSALPPQISQSGENQQVQEIPPGYEPISLIEALNGPLQPTGPLVPAFAPSPIPPFSHSPDTLRHKHHHIDKHQSSNVSLRHTEHVHLKEDTSVSKNKENVQDNPITEVTALGKTAVTADMKTESLPTARSDIRKHKKGFRTSSAPEKMRLLANSVQVVNDEKDAEMAETRSLLESSMCVDESLNNIMSPKASRPCSRNSPISVSTPHSLHLCDRSSKDTSPGGEDSDYFTPEDPSTTILVDQGTDTSLDAPQE